MASMLALMKACIHTLTTDNVREFAGHERAALTLMPISTSRIITSLGSVAPT